MDLDAIVARYLKEKHYTEAYRALEDATNAPNLAELPSVDARGTSTAAGLAALLPAAFKLASATELDKAYNDLRTFVGESLSKYKNEYSSVLFPVFAHLYLNMLARGHDREARVFMEAHHREHTDAHRAEIEQLRSVQTAEQLPTNAYVTKLRQSKYRIEMSATSRLLLLERLESHKLQPVIAVINEHMDLDTDQSRGKARTEGLTALSADESSRMSKTKVHWGQFYPSEVQTALRAELAMLDGTVDDEEAATKIKHEYRELKKMIDNPEAPTAPAEGSRIPIPPLRGLELQARMAALAEVRQRVALGPDALPSACMYTFFNAKNQITCLNLSDDGRAAVAGFADSYMRVWDLTGEGLAAVKRPEDLPMDLTADTLSEWCDPATRAPSKRLVGHSGPVYGCGFNGDKSFIISGSEDGTARLWSMATFTNIAVFRGHNYPVWDATFNPQGYYFATASHDKTARLWNVERNYPLRIFAGHIDDVDCVRFHPNGHYLATGSSDKAIRLWDTLSGECVRVFEGHAGNAVQCLDFSQDGKLLVSGGDDNAVILWDIDSSKKVAKFEGHTDAVNSVCFSGDGKFIASGSQDCSVRLWSTHAANSDAMDMSSDGPASGADLGSSRENSVFKTKATPVFTTRFSRKNLLLTAGVYEG